MAPTLAVAVRPELPLLITMGDPAGIGPEIIVRALSARSDLKRRAIVCGDLNTLRNAAALIARLDGDGEVPQEVMALSGLEDWRGGPDGALWVLQTCDLQAPVPLGEINAAAGQAAADCIAQAARWVLQGRACAVVTAPIHKEALAAAGIRHPGHTEFLQALAAEHVGVSVEQMPVRMMLSTPGLATVLVSIHVSLREALAAVTFERVLQTLRITDQHFQRCGHARARIGVAGLNPHAGEGGLFGREEIDVIAPAIAQAASEGLQVSGPWAPDTVFMKAREGAFDVVIAMYHDQGLIPVKLLGLEHGVNTTLGLPMIRTSPDHGTAFDLAGTGRASASSLIAAADAALRMSAPP